MRKMFKKIGLLAAMVMGATAIAGAASAAPNGTYLIKNNASAQVNLTANTFTSAGTTASFPSSVAGGGGVGSGSASTSANVLSGTVYYQDPATGYGCGFTTVVSYNSGTGLYTFTFNKSVLGGAGSTATCAFTASRNTSTGTYSATATIGGF
ncbi:hypothetical protein [Asticcacaulis benevestitus]|uniref:Uncharacterized protein n=1 Tax=Asticcacaulis benevestitus DSM 16100 = ATCC BAA-896 TaxID=1121022 RepID=V4Q3Z5_9CAUL|nr:hypothetical protein [Asticcacaulis benevestitus]ESQ92550.1 hypothetical protein ABENE_07895 [Asticcacaulis benevestitus DSM 16100 = ATCC BAA-896]